MKIYQVLFLLFAGLLLSACGSAKTDTVSKSVPSKNPQKSLLLKTLQKSKKQAVKKSEKPVVGEILKEKDFAAKIKSLNAKYVIGAVFAPSCSFCVEESMALTKMKPALLKKHISVVGLGITDEKSGCELFFDLTQKKANYSLYCADWAWEKFKLQGTPVLILFDGTGKFIQKFSPNTYEDPLGELTDLIADLSKKK